MQNRKAKIQAVSISCGIHIILIAGAFFLRMPGIYTKFPREQGLFHVKITEKKQPPPISGTEPGRSLLSIQFESPQLTEKSKDLSFLEEADLGKEELYLPEGLFPPLAKSEEKEYDVREPTDEQTIIRQKSNRQTKQEIITVQNISGETPLAKPEELIQQGEIISTEFLDEMPGFTPQLTRDILTQQPSQETSRITQEYTPVITRKKQVESLMEDLLWHLATYQDPKDGQRYFKISLRAGEKAIQLPTHSKEILFLVDCSISIEEDRLAEFKQGLHYCLTHLNKDDLFNIIAFKEDIIAFKESSMEPTEKNIKQAIRFVENLQTGEKTDTYMALEASLQREPLRSPAYIFLLSDGRPTKGITNSQEVINKISRLSQGKTAIFAFTGGLRINRYLLDFITYKNRGWAEYSYRSHLISENLSKMYEKISDPIILNLRYYISGLKNQETFPKSLPDFFQGAEFTLYGKYDDEQSVVLQLLGDMQGQTKEFMVQAAFSQADQGDKDIAQNWAFNKIYYLISQLEYDKENMAIIQEINELSARFNIKTPYREYIQR